ncbi:xylulokinase [Actinomyces ruminicola]|uniref:Sugar (Pentulose or hexulose) kinase n=1 Tax=Actinomyces ruminicola TaxID=332524 RepID=A0A1G9TME2_9ACTO|nr:FGGY-family carbohydrate kinase [Actinomyces ruminicola]SDM48851.1 Sugar (pentulose or hexulose) kinase [Actinomyces ruminicola]
MTPATADIDPTRAALGVEFGSTRIKAVLIDATGTVLADGGHTWDNELVDGVWTYSMDAVVTGLRAAYADLAHRYRERYGTPLTEVGAIGISGMMHGYLPLDTKGELLVPFRTWRNTFTQDSSHTLSELFGLNIPQRWSISHLHHAITHGEAHVTRIARLTTLAGFVHYRLTGRHVLGVGEASGVFPIGPDGCSFDADMLAAFDRLVEMPWRLSDILPEVAVAGQEAGQLTPEGAYLLDPTGTLRPGARLCPPEGDAGTGMVATNSVRPRTGNVSAGTSAFAMIVLDHPLRSLVEQIDLVATPSGAPVAMAHSNNCTSDLNAWVEVFSQFAEAIGHPVQRGPLFDVLLGAAAEGDMDDSGVLSYNYLSGEHLVGLAEGRPLVVRRPEGVLSLAGLMRAHLFAAFASMAYGVKILKQSEDVPIDSMFAHGGIFKTPEIPQRVLAAAFDTPVSVGQAATEGGAWGMALLAGFLLWSEGLPLEDYLDERIFADLAVTTIAPTPAEVAEYARYLDRFIAALPVERAAAEAF